MKSQHQFDNTVEKGKFRYIVFQDEGMFYAVAIELNIVVDGTDPTRVLTDLFDTVSGYVDAVKKSNSRPFALNQEVDPEYEEMWKNLESKTPKVSPYKIYSSGRVYA